MPTPLQLYKFRSLAGDAKERTRDIIVNNRLYWPNPKQLNDPFDCAPVPVFEGTQLQRQSYVRSLIKDFGAGYDKRSRKRIEKATLAKNTTVIEQAMAFQREQLRENVGVCSLSARCDHALMWAHYADSHQGICVELRTMVPGFYFAAAYPVTYSAERPVINMINKGHGDLFERMILTKADFWSYEEEWRLFDRDASGIRDLPPTTIKSVILGALISDIDRDMVISWVKESRQNIAVRQARLDDRLFAIRIDN